MHPSPRATFSSVVDAEEKFILRQFWPYCASLCVKPCGCEISLHWNYTGFNQQFGIRFACMSLWEQGGGDNSSSCLCIFPGTGGHLPVPW